MFHLYYTNVKKNKQRKTLVCIILGNSPASDCGLPTFRNTLSVPSSRARCKVWSMNSERRTWNLYQGRGLLELAEPMIECSETSANHNRTPGKYPKEYIQDSKHGESLKSRKRKLVICKTQFSRPRSLYWTECRLYLNFSYIHPFVENLCTNLQRGSLKLWTNCETDITVPRKRVSEFITVRLQEIVYLPLSF